MKNYYYSQTYELTEELKAIRPILSAAVDYQRDFDEYLLPDSYWTDNRGWLYIRWNVKSDTAVMPVWRYKIGANSEIVAEEIPRKPSKEELLHGKNSDHAAVLVTGDTHGKFERLLIFSQRFGTRKDDLMIILGDAGINYYGGKDDEQPSDVTKAYVERQLDNVGWKVDVVLTHTVPYKYRPVEVFLRTIDQDTVDLSTEKWLGDIEERLVYKKWYAGHYHTDKDIDKLRIMYGKVQLFMNDTDLKFSFV